VFKDGKVSVEGLVSKEESLISESGSEEFRSEMDVSDVLWDFSITVVSSPHLKEDWIFRISFTILWSSPVAEKVEEVLSVLHITRWESTLVWFEKNLKWEPSVLVVDYFSSVVNTSKSACSSRERKLRCLSKLGDHSVNHALIVGSWWVVSEVFSKEVWITNTIKIYLSEKVG